MARAIADADDGMLDVVLMRALQLPAAIEIMRANRSGIVDDRLLASGPARLTKAMGISKPQDGASLLHGGSFYCAQDAITETYRNGDVAQTPRIGLAAGRGDEIPWRFVVTGHPHASRRS